MEISNLLQGAKIVVEENSILKEVQKNQLHILIEFDRICKKHNLTYQLFSGTLLGAIRHGGVIPWDDDIDVCMLRKDYEKFIKVCGFELDSSYFLQTHETDPEYIMQFAKIRKNNSLFVEQATSKTNIHQGIYIDVFPLDNVEPNEFIGKIQYITIYLLGRLNLTRVKMHCLNTKSSFKKMSSLISHYLLKVIPKKTTDSIQKKLYCMFINRDTQYVNHLTNGVSKKRWGMFLRKKSTFNDLILVEFNGHKFPAPANYHEVLTRHYGNYMELPPEDKRISHHRVIKIDVDID